MLENIIFATVTASRTYLIKGYCEEKHPSNHKLNTTKMTSSVGAPRKSDSQCWLAYQEWGWDFINKSKHIRQEMSVKQWTDWEQGKITAEDSWPEQNKVRWQLFISKGWVKTCMCRNILIILLVLLLVDCFLFIINVVLKLQLHFIIITAAGHVMNINCTAC